MGALQLQPRGQCLATWDFSPSLWYLLVLLFSGHPENCNSLGWNHRTTPRRVTHQVPRQSLHLWPTLPGNDVHTQASHLSSFPRWAGGVPHSLPPSRRRKSSISGSYKLQETKADSSLLLKPLSCSLREAEGHNLPTTLLKETAC